jgi:hypothetical protein
MILSRSIETMVCTREGQNEVVGANNRGAGVGCTVK